MIKKTYKVIVVFFDDVVFVEVEAPQKRRLEPGVLGVGRSVVIVVVLIVDVVVVIDVVVFRPGVIVVVVQEELEAAVLHRVVVGARHGQDFSRCSGLRSDQISVFIGNVEITVFAKSRVFQPHTFLLKRKREIARWTEKTNFTKSS